MRLCSRRKTGRQVGAGDSVYEPADAGALPVEALRDFSGVSSYGRSSRTPCAAMVVPCGAAGRPGPRGRVQTVTFEMVAKAHGRRRLESMCGGVGGPRTKYGLARALYLGRPRPGGRIYKITADRDEGLTSFFLLSFHSRLSSAPVPPRIPPTHRPSAKPSNPHRQNSRELPDRPPSPCKQQYSIEAGFPSSSTPSPNLPYGASRHLAALVISRTGRRSTRGPCRPRRRFLPKRLADRRTGEGNRVSKYPIDDAPRLRLEPRLFGRGKPVRAPLYRPSPHGMKSV